MSKPRPGARAYSPEEWDSKIDDFLAACDRGECMPLDYDLMVYTGVSLTTLERYYGSRDSDTSRDNNIYIPYGQSLKKLEQYRTRYFLMRGLADPKSAGMCIFALKQPKNGGWTDKQEISAANDVRITVDVKGADGKPVG